MLATVAAWLWLRVRYFVTHFALFSNLLRKSLFALLPSPLLGVPLLGGVRGGWGGLEGPGVGTSQLTHARRYISDFSDRCLGEALRRKSMILRLKRYSISSITFLSISFMTLLLGSTSLSAEWSLQYYNPTSHLYSHCLPYSIKSWGWENRIINFPAGLQRCFWTDDQNYFISIAELNLEKFKALSYVKLFSYEDKLGWITDYYGTWTSQFANSSFGFGGLSFPNLKRDLAVTSLGQIYLYHKFTRNLKIVIEKSKYTLNLLDDNDNVIVQYKIGIGKTPGDKQSDGDMRTPEGEFYISKIQNSETWTYDFEDDDLGPIVGAYGPWFLRLETGKWDGIGIHGTHLPQSIGTRCTHGCIRMKNKDLNDLKQLIHIGILVLIQK